MLIVSGARVNPVAPASFYDRSSPLLDAVRPPGKSAGRVWASPRPKGFAYRTPPGPNGDALMWGFLWDRMTLRNATGFPYGVRFAFDRGNERLDALPGAALGRTLSDRASHAAISEEDVRLMSLAGVDRIVIYGDAAPPQLPEVGRLEGQSSVPVRVLALPDPVPRAHAVLATEVQPETDRAVRRLLDPAFDPHGSAILEESTTVASAIPARSGEPQVSIVEDKANRVRLRCAMPSFGHVVLADTYDPGWEATVDGRPTAIVRANGMFRAVPVPAGAHDVEFVYRPSSVRSGLMVSLAATALAVFLGIPRRRPLQGRGDDPGPAS
jgi:hypothetical protein